MKHYYNCICGSVTVMETDGKPPRKIKCEWCGKSIKKEDENVDTSKTKRRIDTYQDEHRIERTNRIGYC